MSGRRTKQARRKEPFATTMLPPQPCPVCGAKLDCASGGEGQEPRSGTDCTGCL